MLRLGAFGPPVGALQQALLEAGLSIDKDDLDRTVFGRSTESALMMWQHSHVGPNGHALVADGVAGPATEWALAHPAAPSAKGWIAPGWRCEPTRERAAVRHVLAIAVGEIGVCESPPGSNRGGRVDVYTAPELGIPWCAAGVSWCYEHGCDSGSPFGRILSAHGIAEWGRIHGRLLGPGAMPQAGDLGYLVRADGHGHVWLIVGNSDNQVSTYNVEFNCSNAVRGTVRPRTGAMGYVRPIPLV